jgi:hypothetical protein
VDRGSIALLQILQSCRIVLPSMAVASTLATGHKTRICIGSRHVMSLVTSLVVAAANFVAVK